MRKDKPSVTARKVALNIMTLGAKSGMNEILPRGSVDATAKLLVASGVVGSKTLSDGLNHLKWYPFTSGLTG